MRRFDIPIFKMLDEETSDFGVEFSETRSRLTATVPIKRYPGKVKAAIRAEVKICKDAIFLKRETILRGPCWHRWKRLNTHDFEEIIKIGCNQPQQRAAVRRSG